MSVITSVIERWRQEDEKLNVILGYIENSDWDTWSPVANKETLKAQTVVSENFWPVHMMMKGWEGRHWGLLRRESNKDTGIGGTLCVITKHKAGFLAPLDRMSQSQASKAQENSQQSWLQGSLVTGPKEVSVCSQVLRVAPSSSACSVLTNAECKNPDFSS